MEDNVTATYRKAQQQAEHRTNMEVKSITDRPHNSDRVQIVAKHPAYKILKDHKDKFRTNPTCTHQPQQNRIRNNNKENNRENKQ